jgi:hypothetical protein
MPSPIQCLIPNKHNEEVVFLGEVKLNCALFERAFSALRISAQHRRNLDRDVDHDKPGFPVPIVEQ